MRRDLDERGEPFQSAELCETPKEGLVKVRRGHIPQENAKEWRGRGMKGTQTLLHDFEECCGLLCLEGQGLWCM